MGMVNIDAVCFDLDGTLCVDDQTDEEIYEAIFDRVKAPAFFDLMISMLLITVHFQKPTRIENITKTSIELLHKTSALIQVTHQHSLRRRSKYVTELLCRSETVHWRH